MGVFDYEADQVTIYYRTQIKKYFKPIGLPNIGNTCYMNSLLQTLAGSHRFMEYVKKI